MAIILITEDDDVFRELLALHIEDLGHQPLTAATIQQAREILQQQMPDAILLDQQLPDGLGIDLLEELSELTSKPPVIMITGVTDNSLAIKAMTLGAHDFIRKPMDEMQLDTTLNNALKAHRLSRQVATITNSEDYQVTVGQIIGASPAILDICKTIGSVASRNASVLITGESGTGKEVVARALHHHSNRSGLFLPINCSALAENLLESELFGHEKGSFTGAVTQKEGKFEQAIDGTLFLDELGEMPLSLQAKLLRVLQEGSFERVGGNQTIHSNARVLAATNKDLKQMIKEGTFREDLFYRLNVVHINLPPLRDRMEDLPLLIEHLINKINIKQSTHISNLAENAWKKINGHSWPGNVRELENTLTHAAIIARNDVITADSLTIAKTSTDLNTTTEEVKLKTLDQIDAEHIASILKYSQWHKGKACEILDISRPALERKIKKYVLQ